MLLFKLDKHYTLNKSLMVLKCTCVSPVKKTFTSPRLLQIKNKLFKQKNLYFLFLKKVSLITFL